VGTEVGADVVEQRPAVRPRRWLRRVAYVLTAVLALLSVLAAYVWFAPIPTYTPMEVELTAMPSADRLARGREIAGVLCTQCHFDPATRKLSGRLMPKTPLGQNWSGNITSDPQHGIGSWSDGQIAFALRTGVTPSGRLAAPGMPRLTLLSDEDVLALVTFLRSGDPLVAPSDATHPPANLTFLGRALLHFAVKPAPYPSTSVHAPSNPDPVERGRYLVQAVALCWRCHSESYASHDELHPERSKGYMAGGSEGDDPSGRTILSANLTPDSETGIGDWTEEQFAKALRTGLQPDGEALSPAMPMFDEFSSDETHAIWAYLRTLPAMKHAIPRAAPRVEPAAPPGRLAYVKYGCIGCHGETGVLVGDLRHVNVDLPTDADLLAWIEHPSAKRPGTKMPDFAGVIAPEDYVPLMAYVRSLPAPATASAR
jgi:mono/diheme cytochrome c family protein